MSILYHYTDVIGLLGILDKGCVRATNAAYLNDSLEFEAGRSVFDGISSEISGPLPAVLSAHKFYVACFSSVGDLLSQWRGYASNGAGYAIGFDVSEIKKNISSHLKISKVDYEEGIFKDKILKLYEKVGKETKGNRVKEMLAAFDDFLFAFLEYKNSGFFEEQEYRIISSSRRDLEVEYRGRSGLIIPYTEIKIANKKNVLPISEIVIGPNLDFEMAKHSLELFLKSKGYDAKKIVIKRSGTSYR
jgi:Protein of unknown function (DUF2971)